MRLGAPAFVILATLLLKNTSLCQDDKELSTVTNEIESVTKATVREKNQSSSLPDEKVPFFETKPSYFNPNKYVCPEKDARRPFFSIRCKSTKECMMLGNKNLLCCENRCLKGVPAPPPEPKHSPTLFGLIERSCPVETIPEILEIKQCKTDSDCSPRICCPEKMQSGETIGYCRTAEAKLDNIPVAKQFVEPLKLFMSYMQCTPPPPPILDVFPKTCNNPLDCFPNLCCQERGKKFCRPPKRSLLTLLTTVAQRIVPTDVARDFITRITS